MIIVYLKNGEDIEIQDGVRADYVRTIRRVENAPDDVVVTTLDVRDNKSSYSGNLVASFKADEVLYYTCDNATEEEK